MTSWLALAEMDLDASLQYFNVGYEHGVGEKEHIDTDVQVKAFDK